MVSKAKLALIAAITALGIASPATAELQSYPWCIQGGTYRCWYMTHEQCEEAVNYRGFCVTNPMCRGIMQRNPWLAAAATRRAHYQGLR